MVIVLAGMPSAGCMRTTTIPAAEIPRLRPLMRGERPGVTSVVLQGDRPIRVRADSEMELVISHRGREMRATVTPGRLAWRTDGLWLDEDVVSASSILGLEMRTFSLGRTLGLIALCAAGTLITAYLALYVFISSTSVPGEG